MIHAGEFTHFRQEAEKLAVSADWVKFMLSKTKNTPEAKRRVAALVRGTKRGGERQSMKLRDVVEETITDKPNLAEKVLQTVGLSKPKTRTVYSPKHVGEARKPIIDEMNRQQGLQFALEGSAAGSRPLAERASPALMAAEQSRLQRMFGRPAEVIQFPRTAEEAALAIAA